MTSGMLLLLVYVALCLMKPVAFSLTHLSARACGNLDTGEVESPVSVQQQAARCLIQAHQQCQSATLQVKWQGIDTSARPTLATANSFGGCQLTVDGPSRFIIVDVLYSLFPLNVLAPQETTCQSLSLQPTGLFLQGCEVMGHVYTPWKFLRWANP